MAPPCPPLVISLSQFARGRLAHLFVSIIIIFCLPTPHAAIGIDTESGTHDRFRLVLFLSFFLPLLRLPRVPLPSRCFLAIRPWTLCYHAVIYILFYFFFYFSSLSYHTCRLRIHLTRTHPFSPHNRGSGARDRCTEPAGSLVLGTRECPATAAVFACVGRRHRPKQGP